MSSNHNPGRVAGLWYLLLSVIAPLRLMYIPTLLSELAENSARTYPE
jgi:hypothetical protein